MLHDAAREPRSVTLRVRITKSLEAELARLAAGERRTLSAMAELLIEQAITERQKR